MRRMYYLSSPLPRGVSAEHSVRDFLPIWLFERYYTAVNEIRREELDATIYTFFAVQK